VLHQAHNRFNAQEIWQQDHDHFLHPYTHFDSFRANGSLVLVEGEGCYVTDAHGRRYFDGIGGMWCVNAGYGRKEIAEAMAEQAMQLCYTTTFVDVTNAPAARLAAKLAELAPGNLNHVAYATSGSCAVDTAIRLAHYYQSRRGEPGRRYVISRRNSYHGSTYLTQSVGKRNGDRVEEFRYQSEGIYHLSSPYLYRRPDHMTEAQFCDHLIAEFEALIARLQAIDALVKGF
jgi:adenosylmethionine-8-amino-7-oxononanoate aminotransferase